jgi:hypothetical protein
MPVDSVYVSDEIDKRRRGEVSNPGFGLARALV